MKCQRCGGNGWLIIMPQQYAPTWYDKECPDCKGTGRITLLRWILAKIGVRK